MRGSVCRVACPEVGLGRAGQGGGEKSIVVFTRRPRRDAAGFVVADDFALEYRELERERVGVLRNRILREHDSPISVAALI